jgi:hypothetical protein
VINDLDKHLHGWRVFRKMLVVRHAGEVIVALSVDSRIKVDRYATISEQVFVHAIFRKLLVLRVTVMNEMHDPV